MYFKDYLKMKLTEEIKIEKEQNSSGSEVLLDMIDLGKGKFSVVDPADYVLKMFQGCKDKNKVADIDGKYYLILDVDISPQKKYVELTVLDSYDSHIYDGVCKFHTKVKNIVSFE